MADEQSLEDILGPKSTADTQVQSLSDILGSPASAQDNTQQNPIIVEKPSSQRFVEGIIRGGKQAGVGTNQLMMQMGFNPWHTTPEAMAQKAKELELQGKDTGISGWLGEAAGNPANLLAGAASIPAMGAYGLLHGLTEPTTDKTQSILSRFGKTGAETATSMIVPKAAGAISKRLFPSATAKFEHAKDLVMPDSSTQSGAEEIVSKGTQTEPKYLGIFGGKIIPQATARQEESALHVSSIKGFSPYNSVTKNYNLVKNEIGKAAESLKSSLKNNNMSFINISHSPAQYGIDDFGRAIITSTESTTKEHEFNGILDNIVNNVTGTETLQGSPKAAVIESANKMKELISQNPPTPYGLLEARKQFDNWVTTTGNKKYLTPESLGAYGYMAKEVRDAANNFLEYKIPDIGVKKSLAKQSALFRAKDAMEPKAAKELVKQTGSLSTAENIATGAIKAGKKAVKLGTGIITP